MLNSNSINQSQLWIEAYYKSLLETQDKYAIHGDDKALASVHYLSFETVR